MFRVAVATASRIANAFPLAAAAAVVPRAHLHLSAIALGGRHSSDRLSGDGHSRPSKKARKRMKRRTERMAAAAPTPAAAPPTPPRVSAAALRQLSRANRAVVESVALPAAAAPSRVEALRAVEPAALLAAIDRGLLDVTDAGAAAHAVAVLSAHGRFDSAVELVAALRRGGVPLAAPIFTALITACGDQRNLQAALEVFDAMRDEAGLPPASPSLALLAAGGQALPALPTPSDHIPGSATAPAAAAVIAVTSGETPSSAHLAHPCRPTAVTYGALIQACVRARQLATGYRVLTLALQEGAQLGPVAFTALIVGCVHEGRYSEAQALYQHMRTYHCEPDAVTFTALISACGKVDEVERALGYLTEMRQMGLTPTTVTYNALIHAAARSMRLHEQALQLFDQMPAAGVARDLRTYNAVLLACTHGGDVPMSRRIMRLLYGAGLEPDIVTYNTLLAVHARALRPARRNRPNAGGVVVPYRQLATAVAGPAAAIARPNLLALERGAGDDVAAAVATKALGQHARVIEGDTATLVESLLADYYADDGDARSSKDEGTGQGDHDGGDEAGDRTAIKRAVEASVDEDPAAFTPPARLLTPLPADDGETTAVLARMRAEGVLDESLQRELDEEMAYAAQPLAPARQGDGADARVAAEAERSEALWRRTVSERVRELAAKEAHLTAVREETESLAAGLRGSRGDGSQAAASPAHELSDLEDSITAGLSAAPTSIPAAAVATVLVQGHASGGGDGVGRITIDSYLRQLEAEVEASLAVDRPSALALPAGSGKPSTGAGGTAHLPSLLDDDAELGGVPVSQLLDISDVAVPRANTASGEHDIIELHDHFARIVAGRIDRALAREIGETEAAIGSPMPPHLPAPPPALGTGHPIPSDRALPHPRSLSMEVAAAVAAERAAAAPSLGSPSPALPPYDPAWPQEKRVVARVLRRLLRTTVLPSLERALVAAAESPAKAAARATASGAGGTGATPTLVDAMLAVRGLAGAAVSADPEHSRLTAAATAMAEAPPGRGTARLAALADMSSRVLAGAQWLAPSGGGDDSADDASERAAPATITSLTSLSTPGAEDEWRPSRGDVLSGMMAVYEREMVAARVPPDIITLNTVVMGLSNAGRIADALTLVTRDFPAAGLRPDARTYRALIRAYVEQRPSPTAAADAEALLRSMVGRGLVPDADSYGLVVHACARDMRLRDAINYLREMRVRGVGPLPERYAALLRRRMAEAGLQHDDVPRHPVAWQFTPAVVSKRLSRGTQLHKTVAMMKARQAGGR